MIKLEEIIEMVKILYVEDEDISRTITEKMLKRRTKKLFIAKNGKEGLELFKIHKPDIVITDLRMPILDGLSMIKEIRSFNQDCGIMITSELKDITVILQGVDIGIDKYMIKPLNEEEIDEAIITVLKKMCKRKNYDELFASIFELSKDDKKKMEDNIKTEMSNFLKKAMGKGPRYVKVSINLNTIEVTAYEVLTSMEKTLIRDKNNLNLIEYNRKLFYVCQKNEIEKIITQIVHKESTIKSTHINILGDEDRLIFKYF